MQFFSTRDKNIKRNSYQVILEGLSPDGGLYIAENLKNMGPLESLLDKSYIDLASYLVGLIFDDFSKEELDQMMKAAYAKNFPKDPVPLSDFDGFSLIELFHGKTLAFKDLGLSLLPQLMKKSIEKVNFEKDVLILVATSGDTGKATLEAFKNVDRTRVVVFYPKDGVSEIQYRQMATQEGSNLEVVAVEGNFDDCQRAVKDILTDKKMIDLVENEGYIFSTANSINFGRLVGQIVYYVYSYLRLVKNSKIQMGEEINICVPTGNFGNILAAFYAYRMGLPVKNFILGSNDNRVLVDFLNTNKYDANRKLILTSSPSMDILVSSNLERLLYYFLDGDSKKIKKLMEDFARTGSYDFPEKIDRFYGYAASEEEVSEAIKEIFEKYGYVIDPHTAVAVKAYEKYKEATKDQTYTLIASTASAFKFQDKVLKSLGIEVGKNSFENLRKLEKISGKTMAESLKELEEKKIIRSDQAEVDKIKEKLIEIIRRER